MSMQKTAVLGAGTMGSRIAAHMANAGAEVILLDIVPDDAGNDRNKLAKAAIEKLSGNGHAFTYPTNAQRITPGNFEDDMDKLELCDWIVEAVIENQEIKTNLYKQVDRYRKEGSILSSNTSTIPLRKLKENLSPELKNDLVITHFFNPPRQMRLLELVSGKSVKDRNGIGDVVDFIDRKLGKTIVEVKDTPGFIGNRLGIFWMLSALEQALEKNVPVPMVDEIMGKKLGFPKTGIFGLFDMIGVDLMKELTHSLRDQLPEDDAYQDFDRAMEFLDHMEQDSFYKKENGKRLSLNLQTGKYEEPPEYSVNDDLNLKDILLKKTQACEYACAVLLKTLNYTCNCLPEITDSVYDVDTVMKLGFNWEEGPFEMIDALGNSKPGAAILIEALEDNDLIPAPFLQKARSGSFYKTQKNKLYYLIPKDGYKPKTVPEEKMSLADRTRDLSPVLESEKAKLWNLEDGIACLQLTTKFDTMSPQMFDFIHEAIEEVERNFAGMIVGDDDKHFSAGLDLNLVLKLCEKKDWDAISKIIRYGQQTMQALKCSPFPVVGAPSGKALGGACEMLLHCDAIQAYTDSHIGLVEVKIGLVPAWGGCTQMLLRHLRHAVSANAELQACETVFNTISHAKTSSSAEDFAHMIASPESFNISMNRDRLLYDARQLCLSLISGYRAPAPAVLEIPQAAAMAVFKNEIENCEEDKQKTPHECDVLRFLSYVLSGGCDGPEILGDLELSVMESRMKNGKVPNKISEEHMMDIEHDAFMALIQTKETQEKIKAVL